jgi:hypothetical protein
MKAKEYDETTINRGRIYEGCSTTEYAVSGPACKS